MSTKSLAWVGALALLLSGGTGCRRTESVTETPPAAGTAISEKGGTAAGQAAAGVGAVAGEAGTSGKATPAGAGEPAVAAGSGAGVGAEAGGSGNLAAGGGPAAGGDPAAAPEAAAAAPDAGVAGGAAGSEKSAPGGESGGEPQPGKSADIVVGEELTAEEERAPVAGHVGPEFKLTAIMMLSDVVKYPDHYSSFETVQLRGKVLARADNRLLLGHEMEDGTLYVAAIDLGKFGRRNFEVGKMVFFEGRLERQDWSLELFPGLDTGGRQPQPVVGHLLVMESGEVESGQ